MTMMDQGTFKSSRVMTGENNFDLNGNILKE